MLREADVELALDLTRKVVWRIGLVGDHVDADVLGARAVGITGVLIDRRGRYAPDEIPPETEVITSLDQLVPLVDARNGAA
jgi:FMN phosphatase YigB (HAD superfamily)